MSGCRAASSFVLSCGGGKKEESQKNSSVKCATTFNPLKTTLTYFSSPKGVSNWTQILVSSIVGK